MGLENRHNCSQPDDIKSSDHRRDMPNSDKTDNAGLELTADMLEEIYTNKDFPKSALPLKVSLADSGKSRADLWSFAAAIGVELGIQRNNLGCDGEHVEPHPRRRICSPALLLKRRRYFSPALREVWEPLRRRTTGPASQSPGGPTSDRVRTGD